MSTPESRTAAWSLAKGDKKVIDAFLDKRKLESKKMSTDGKTLDIIGMGGRGVAKWSGSKVDLVDLGSRTGQTVHRYIRKQAPAAWLKGATMSAAATPSDTVLRSRLIHTASELPKGDERRTKILAILRRGEFDPEEIAETVPGALENGSPEETYQADHFKQQEFHELGEKQESGQLNDGQPDDSEADLPAGHQEKQAERALYEGLVRLASSNEGARPAILNLLREAGYIKDEKAAKQATSKRASEFASKTAAEKKAMVLASMTEEDRTLRAGLIRMAKAKPESQAKIVAMVQAFDKEIEAGLKEGKKPVPEAFLKNIQKMKDKAKGKKDDDKGKKDDDKGKKDDDKDDDSGKPWEKKKKATKTAAFQNICKLATSAKEAAAAGYQFARQAHATKDQAVQAGREAAAFFTAKKK
jgi:hypothetical protein